MPIMSLAHEALANAQGNSSTANYAAIFSGFAAKGIPEPDILPRENVLTFWAWQAVGRKVKRGEHGVRVVTWIPMTKKDSDGVAQPIGRKPRTTTVFHISQTEPIDGFVPELKAHPVEQRAREVSAESYFSDEFTPIGERA